MRRGPSYGCQVGAEIQIARIVCVGPVLTAMRELAAQVPALRISTHLGLAGASRTSRIELIGSGGRGLQVSQKAARSRGDGPTSASARDRRGTGLGVRPSCSKISAVAIGRNTQFVESPTRFIGIVCTDNIFCVASTGDLLCSDIGYKENATRTIRSRY